ncbi:hypothetical protein [Candidatus Poriferisocius sp.]|uniref:hypothetical protein n=1 Tax=Candidatus Poriferisocius sp. TaxID=3101276 RepID=UPI003B527719
MHLKEILEKVRSSAGPQNEESAKFQVIAPILHALGWDPSDGEQVLFEHSVGGKKGGRVDIALKDKSRVLALIEAKAPGADLSTHVEQVLGYAFHEGVDICVLTTGDEWWLYLPREPGEPLKRRFAVLMVEADPLEQLAEDFDRFLGRSSLTGGQSLRQARRVLKAGHEADRLRTEMPKIWERMLDAPDDELVELISKRVYDKVSIRPSNEQVVAVLHNSPVPMAAPPIPEQSGEEPEKGKAAERSALTPTVKPVAIVLWGDRYPVETHADVLRTVAEKLFERHSGEFDKLLELRGRKRPFVARDPHALLKPERSYEVAASGFFVDMNLSAASIRRRCEEFLGCFGYPSSALEVLVDQRVS